MTGRFGRNPTYWSERFLDDGLVHLLATDAHDTKHRAPLLAEGQVAAERWVGAEEARLLVLGRPQAIIANLASMNIPLPPALRRPTRQKDAGRQNQSWLARFFAG